MSRGTAPRRSTKAPPTPRSSLEEAQRRLGFEQLRPGQREAVEAVLAGRDVLVVMPTGSGKSAIYQLATLVQGGPTSSRRQSRRSPRRTNAATSTTRRDDARLPARIRPQLLRRGFRAAVWPLRQLRGGPRGQPARAAPVPARSPGTPRRVGRRPG